MESVFAKTKEKMDKCLTSLERDFAAIRAGRANPAVLDKVMVDYYGVPTPINQMATVSVPEARLLVVQPWDASTLKEIEKAINTADIGINPQNDGKVIRLSFPQPECLIFDEATNGFDLPKFKVVEIYESAKEKIKNMR